MRKSAKERKTKETTINLRLNLDGSGLHSIQTGIGFFDHMLGAFSLHSGFDLDVECSGDLDVDCHHTVEDVGITLGSAFAEAAEDKKGLGRYGTFTLPMDEALAQCSVDISGRPYLVFHADFDSDKVGELDLQTVREFFYAFAINAKLTLHINLLYGTNDHHKVEAIFKAFAHALKIAARKEEDERVLSTKGSL